MTRLALADKPHQRTESRLLSVAVRRQRAAEQVLDPRVLTGQHLHDVNRPLDA